MALRIPGIAVEGSDRRGSARYFISPAYPRASHSGIRLSSVNFSTRTTPQRSKPSDFASSTTRKVSVRGLIKEIVPYRREPSEPQTGGPPEGSAKPVRPCESTPTGGEFRCYATTGRVCSAKTPNSGVLVCKHIEDSVQLGDLKKIADFLRQMQQLQVPALILHRREPANQFADPRAVDVVDVGEIQENFFSLIIQQPANRLSQQRATVSEDDPAAQVHDSNLAGIAVGRM